MNVRIAVKRFMTSKLCRKLRHGLTAAIVVSIAASFFAQQVRASHNRTSRAAAFSKPAQESAKVTILRTPNGGIQPQATVDETGSIHLGYFVGDPPASDLLLGRSVGI